MYKRSKQEKRKSPTPVRERRRLGPPQYQGRGEKIMGKGGKNVRRGGKKGRGSVAPACGGGGGNG